MTFAVTEGASVNVTTTGLVSAFANGNSTVTATVSSYGNTASDISNVSVTGLVTP